MNFLHLDMFFEVSSPLGFSSHKEPDGPTWPKGLCLSGTYSDSQGLLVMFLVRKFLGNLLEAPKRGIAVSLGVLCSSSQGGSFVRFFGLLEARSKTGSWKDVES